jgi:hypothetical protein
LFLPRIEPACPNRQNQSFCRPIGDAQHLKAFVLASRRSNVAPSIKLSDYSLEIKKQAITPSFKASRNALI